MKILFLLVVLISTNAAAQECIELSEDLIQCKVDKSVCIFKTISCYDVQ